ncbi:MgtC/SapB family protein [Paenibacillus typhae]|uniref:Putative Mg2+ transporter-C (MgtC) family protein n=1 Tax=Paenibacillus typhae TaxID=1174501 RepID=A0A1G9AZN6_9BACL|nr:MgtC/SapB family protein [Paenibacillus typhae]SDK32703.1 putative Mg2+ transporter-C (MgtC) family protein [Paenibacillus typhae]
MTANPAIWHIDHLEIAIRIAVALLVGGLVGLERERGQHHAGLRTHILVCLGSTLITLISTYGFGQFASEPNVRMDPARLTAQIISGIGFLGAGTILRTGNSISGLTTAASLWVVAAMGIAIGAGFYFGAILTFVSVLVCLFVLQWVERHIRPSGKSAVYTVTVAKEGDPGFFLNFFRDEHIKVKSFKMDMLEDGAVRMHFILSSKHSDMKQKISKMSLNREAGIQHMEIGM